MEAGLKLKGVGSRSATDVLELVELVGMSGVGREADVVSGVMMAVVSGVGRGVEVVLKVMEPGVGTRSMSAPETVEAAEKTGDEDMMMAG